MKLSAIKTKPNLWDLLVGAVVVLAAAALFLSFWRGSAEEQLTAVVCVDGTQVERVALRGELTERVYTANGYTLTVQFCPEGVAGVQVAHSDCPTQDCVNTGCVVRPGQSIVCLPARLSIELSGGSGGLDATVG